MNRAGRLNYGEKDITNSWTISNALSYSPSYYGVTPITIHEMLYSQGAPDNDNSIIAYPFVISYKMLVGYFEYHNNGSINARMRWGIYSNKPGTVAPDKLIWAGNNWHIGVSGRCRDVLDPPILLKGNSLYWVAYSYNTGGSTWLFSHGLTGELGQSLSAHFLGNDSIGLQTGCNRIKATRGSYAPLPETFPSSYSIQFNTNLIWFALRSPLVNWGSMTKIELSGSPLEGSANGEVIASDQFVYFYFDVPTENASKTWNMWTNLNGTLTDSCLVLYNNILGLVSSNFDCGISGCNLNHSPTHSRIDSTLASARYILGVRGQNYGDTGTFQVRVREA